MSRGLFLRSRTGSPLYSVGSLEQARKALWGRTGRLAISSGRALSVSCEGRTRSGLRIGKALLDKGRWWEEDPRSWPWRGLGEYCLLRSGVWILVELFLEVVPCSWK